jgi:cytochrome c556
MNRTLLAAAAVVIGITAVAAQSDPIAARKEIMKGVGAQTKAAAAMAKGEAPFDQAKAVQIFTTYEDAAAKMPALFPPNSKSGGETTAAAKIWEDKTGFEKAFAKFGLDAKNAKGNVKDLDSFKANFGGVAKNCGGCHESYRVKKS